VVTEQSASTPIRVLVQARMSSRRFPGKVLAPFRGTPLIRWVLNAVADALPATPVHVATSADRSDDPLACYLAASGFSVFRGPLESVFERFRACAAEHPCDWILRVSADSPLLSVHVLERVAAQAKTAFDLVTTVFPRTFPRGSNAELIRVSTFAAIDPRELTVEDHEHVTSFYYRHPERFRILNVESPNPKLAETSLAVDTVEDLHRLERAGEVERAGFVLARRSR